MAPHSVSAAEADHIDSLVAQYAEDIATFRAIETNISTLLALPRIAPLYHSMRSRTKDPAHLKDKLVRKLILAKSNGLAFDITSDNLFERITDLAGLRLLHLHTSQFEAINAALLELLEENQYPVLEGPEARTWDDEYETIFANIGIKTVKSVRMYTSVHYVVQATTKTKRTAEIQVRTLAEELWGEVDHSINYPETSNKLACREQIKVLARLTSSCTRLVDSIFATHNEDVLPNGSMDQGALRSADLA